MTGHAPPKRLAATIMGSGTSTGCPPIAWDPPEEFRRDPRNYRMRAGLLLREDDPPAGAGGRALVVDCGPDFYQQALKHAIKRLDGMLLTHTHYDHVGGLDDLRIFNFRQGHSLPVYGMEEHFADLRSRFSYIFGPREQEGGGVASLDLVPVHGPFDFLGMRIRPLPVMHGVLPILGYRFGDFAFVTDASFISRETMAEIRGCRTFVLNALRPRPHATHFCLDEAVDVAKEVGAERTWFIHMTHYLEHNETNAKLPRGIELAWDGLSFEVEPEPAP